MPPATSPLYERVAAALSASTEAVRAIGSMPARQRRPAVLLAALHDLALAGRAPALAAAYAAGYADAAADAAVDVSTVDGARWLRASLPPDRPERRARLDAELALAASAPPQLLRGDFVDLLPEAIARVPASLRAEAVGRCWLRGSMLAWLTGTSAGRRTNISTATKTPVSASVPNAPSAEDAVTRATTSASPRSTRIRMSTGSAVTLMDTPRNSAKAE